MDQDTKNDLDRQASLADYFDETKKRWEGVPALKKRIDKYLSLQGALPKPPPDVDRDNTTTTGAQSGATQDKTTARQRLAELLTPVAASVHLWLIDADNLPKDDELAAANQRALAATLDIRRPSALLKMAAGQLIGLAQATLDGLTLVPAADLAEFDLTTDDTKDFEDTAKLFGARRTGPSAVANAAGIAAQTLAQTLDELDDYVMGELKKAVDIRRSKDPEFVRGFKKAYRLFDRSATRKSKGKAKPDGGTQANG